MTEAALIWQEYLINSTLVGPLTFQVGQLQSLEHVRSMTWLKSHLSAMVSWGWTSCLMDCHLEACFKDSAQASFSTAVAALCGRTRYVRLGLALCICSSRSYSGVARWEKKLANRRQSIFSPLLFKMAVAPFTNPPCPLSVEMASHADSKAPRYIWACMQKSVQSVWNRVKRGVFSVTLKDAIPVVS